MIQAQQSFFEMMKAENYTIFSLCFDWKKNETELSMSREWSNKASWAGKKSTGLLKRAKKIGDAETRQLVRKYDLDEYLTEIIFTMREGRHEKLELLHEPGTDARCVIVLHHMGKEFVVGGIRRAPAARPEQTVVVDALCLSREMTFRCAVGNMPCGGAILSVHNNPPKENVADSFFAFLAYAIERSQLYVAPETGFSMEEVDKIRAHTDRCVIPEQDRRNAISTAATYSVYLSIKEALQFRYGDSSLEGKQIGIQGMGSIGSSLAEMLLGEGADLIIADINSEHLDNFLKNCPDTKNINVVEPHEIRMQMGHVFAPCAASGILTRDTIRDIEYHMVIGGANHLMAANTYEEELTLANRMAKKGILYIPDWISNVGAVMYGVSLFREKKKVKLEDKQKEIEKICRPLLQEILQRSREVKLSPLEVAYQKFESSVYG